MAPVPQHRGWTPGRLVLLLAPFGLLGVAGRWAVTPLGEKVAAPVARGAALLAEAMRRPEARPLPPLPGSEAIAALDGAERSSPRDAGHGDRTVEEPTTLALPKPAGILVPRSRVLAAARAGARPGGSAVGATGWRGSGLALVGVAAAGVGLRDGDVLVRVGGTPATSEGAVIGAVTAALRQGHKAIAAEVWRGRQKILVTVELPRVRMPAAKPSRVTPASRKRAKT